MRDLAIHAEGLGKTYGGTVASVREQAFGAVRL